MIAGNSRRARRYSLAPLLDADVDEDFDRDVADLCERTQRSGSVGIDDPHRPASDDGWRAFCGRHGTYGFDWHWKDWAEAERVRRVEERAAEARWAAERRERQVAAKRQADQAWWESSQPAAQREEAEHRSQQLDRAWQALEAAKRVAAAAVARQREAARQHEDEARAEWERQAQAQQRADAEHHQRQQAILSAQMADAQRAWSAIEPGYAGQQFVCVTLHREIRVQVSGTEVVLYGTVWAPWSVLSSYLFR